MLALKLGMSIGGSNRPMGASWTPAKEGTDLVAWYKNQEGITLNGSDVSAWADSSSNSFDMVQATASEQPAYNSGNIEFTPADTQNLQSASDITLSGAFTVGIKFHPAADNVAVISSNTLPNEFFKLISSTVLRFKTDNNQVDLSLDEGTFLADLDLVFTRNASNLITLYVNGVAQSDTETLSGTADINAIGVRRINNNPYDGTISEVQIYRSTSAELTANINTYLSTL
tara:strand:+ start:14 stop:700 length:687 start_codon:yes stop_codon:yes gene_type:complete